MTANPDSVTTTTSDGIKTTPGWWQPQPVTQPIVNAQFPELNALTRSSEVLRYSLHRFEYWLSPRGILREWLRLNLLVAVLLLIPAATIGPVVTWLLVQIAGWVVLLLQIVRNVTYTVAFLLLLCISLQALRARLKKHHRSPTRRHGNSKHNHHN